MLLDEAQWLSRHLSKLNPSEGVTFYGGSSVKNTILADNVVNCGDALLPPGGPCDHRPRLQHLR
jgi:hypothetical protein